MKYLELFLRGGENNPTTFIKETTRLHMVIHLLMPHMNLKQGKLGGYDIPKESKILVNAWYLANNLEWWDKPEEFRSDNFLGTKKIEGNGNDFWFISFGVRRRSCPGIILVIPLVDIVLGQGVQSFEFLPPPGHIKVGMPRKGGQFSLYVMNKSIVVCRPLL